MNISCRLSFKEYLKGMYAMAYRTFPVIGLTVLGGLFLSIVLLYFGFYIFSDRTEVSSDIIKMGIFSLGFILIMPISIFLQARMSYKTHANVKEQIQYSFNQDDIQIKGESFKSEIHWSSIHKVLELKNWVFIYHNQATANIIPKRVFNDEQLTEFREIVKQQPNIKKKLRKK